jgi:large subunit ribosomal protein L21
VAPVKATKIAEPKVEAAAPKAEAKPVEPKAKATKDLSTLTVAELKEMAKAKGIEGISSMKKADLIAALS